MENTSNNQSLVSEKLSFDRFRQEVLKDYKMACESREASLLGERSLPEAKVGILGEGGIAQILPPVFNPGVPIGLLSGQNFHSPWRSRSKNLFTTIADPDRCTSSIVVRQMKSHLPLRCYYEGECGSGEPETYCGGWPHCSPEPRHWALLSHKLFPLCRTAGCNDLCNGNEVSFCPIVIIYLEVIFGNHKCAGMQVPLAVFVWKMVMAFCARKYRLPKVLSKQWWNQKRDNTNRFDIYKVKRGTLPDGEYLRSHRRSRNSCTLYFM